MARTSPSWCAAAALACALSFGCKKKQADPQGQPKPPAEAEPSGPADDARPAAVTDEAPGAFEGDEFAFDVPAGYEALPESRVAEFEQSLGQNVSAVLIGERKKPDDFVASIVIVEVADTGDELRKVDNCKVASEVMASAQDAEVKVPAKEVELPFGKTCQFEVGDSEQHAIQTVAYLSGTSGDKSGDKYWVVTCNMDPDDIDARRNECEKVLTSFRKAE